MHNYIFFPRLAFHQIHHRSKDVNPAFFKDKPKTETKQKETHKKCDGLGEHVHCNALCLLGSKTTDLFRWGGVTTAKSIQG